MDKKKKEHTFLPLPTLAKPLIRACAILLVVVLCFVFIQSEAHTLASGL